MLRTTESDHCLHSEGLAELVANFCGNESLGYTARSLHRETSDTTASQLGTHWWSHVCCQDILSKYRSTKMREHCIQQAGGIVKYQSTIAMNRMGSCCSTRNAILASVYLSYVSINPKHHTIPYNSWQFNVLCWMHYEPRKQKKKQNTAILDGIMITYK